MKQRNLNFRQSRSERSGENAYSNFKKEMVRKFKMDSIKDRFKFSKSSQQKKGK